MTNLASLREQKELRYAKKGLALALMSGMIWSSDGLILGKGLAEEPFGSPALWLFAPLLAAGLHDFCAACLSLAINGAQGKGREVIRTLRSKAGRACIWGALLGAPLGMGGYLMALSMAGPAYVLPITSLYPAIAALLALVFLKEHVSLRAWGGLALCVIGAIAIGYTPPEGAGGGLFYLGIAFAFLAAFGWAAEGVCVTSGMDFIEPAVALNVYQIVSSLLYAGIIVPLALWHLSASAPGWRRLSPCCGRKRHKGPTSRARNCCPNRYGEGKYRQLGQATLAENPIRRSVWRDSRPFSRPGARRD